MSHGREGFATSRGFKHNASNQYHLKRNGYKRYDWRPRGRDGESKKPPSRATCPAAEVLSWTSSPRCGTHLDIHPAGLPSCTNTSSPRRQSPSSITSLCDYRPCHASEKFSQRVSPSHSKHGEKCSGGSSPRHSPRDMICLRHNCVAPGMEPAGIITRNYEYPYPPEMHSIVRLDSYVKHQGVYKGLGKLVKDSFRPRLGDAMIVKMPRVHAKKDSGYVEYVTTKHEGCHFCPGDLLLRVGKFVQSNTWRFNKRYKLYKQTDEHRWLLIGMIDNFVNLLPVIGHGINSHHVDQHCRFFVPRRGDMVVHLQPPDRASQLEWFNPKTIVSKGDILVRMYVGEPPSNSGSDLSAMVEAAIEIYMYSGKGFGWIFMGRDDCWYKDGFDLLGS